MRVPLTAGGYRERLLDAMASLLVDLHRAGVYWGDLLALDTPCSGVTAGTIQAYLVDAETSEIYAALSTGQRAYDLDSSSRTWRSAWPTSRRTRVTRKQWTTRLRRSESVRHRYTALWRELHDQIDIQAGDRFAHPGPSSGGAQRARLRDRRDSSCCPARRGRSACAPPWPSATSTPASWPVSTGLVALEGQARLLPQRPSRRSNTAPG